MGGTERRSRGERRRSRRVVGVGIQREAVDSIVRAGSCMGEKGGRREKGEKESQYSNPSQFFALKHEQQSQILQAS